jgi:hypothetical protein
MKPICIINLKQLVSGNASDMCKFYMLICKILTNFFRSNNVSTYISILDLHLNYIMESRFFLVFLYLELIS